MLLHISEGKKEKKRKRVFTLESFALPAVTMSVMFKVFTENRVYFL